MQKNSPEFSLPNRWLYACGVCAVILVLACNLLTIGRQAPWEDEVFAVSTGLSLARSHPPILSVLAQYPGTGSPILFYGPVSFEAEALLIRVFGLSLVAWRLVCLAGVILSAFAGWRLVKLAGGGRWAQLITVLAISLASSVGSPLPGRWDAVTSGLFLCGLLLLLPGIEINGRVPFRESILAGTLIAFALASTPRAITLSLAALVGLVLTGVSYPKSAEVLLRGCGHRVLHGPGGSLISARAVGPKLDFVVRLFEARHEQGQDQRDAAHRERRVVPGSAAPQNSHVSVRGICSDRSVQRDPAEASPPISRRCP